MANKKLAKVTVTDDETIDSIADSIYARLIKGEFTSLRLLLGVAVRRGFEKGGKAETAEMRAALSKATMSPITVAPDDERVVCDYEQRTRIIERIADTLEHRIADVLENRIPEALNNIEVSLRKGRS